MRGIPEPILAPFMRTSLNTVGFGEAKRSHRQQQQQQQILFLIAKWGHGALLPP
jgi:hypothetical protein